VIFLCIDVAVDQTTDQFTRDSCWAAWTETCCDWSQLT